MANMVVTGSTEKTPRIGTLFEGLKFFVQRNVPLWKQLTDDIKANGGQIVPVERDAQYLIADHLKPTALGGSYSYTLIETALKKGVMLAGEELASHATGARTIVSRPVGSSGPTKGTRTAFSSNDDRILDAWVREAEARGEPLKGNRTYQKLAAVYPHHTHQSWRNRYVKRLESGLILPGNSASTVVNPASVPAVAAADKEPAKFALAEEAEEPALKRRKIGSDRIAVTPKRPALQNFTQPEFDMLLDQAERFEDIHNDQQEEAWQVYQDAHPEHTGVQWKQFYEEKVRPIFLRDKVKATDLQCSVVQDDTLTGALGWSKEEDDVIVQGMARGWSSTQIADLLPRARSSAAVRNRRVLLRQASSLQSPEYAPNVTDLNSAFSREHKVTTTNHIAEENQENIERFEVQLPNDVNVNTSEDNRAAEEQINREAQASQHLAEQFDAQERNRDTLEHQPTTERKALKEDASQTVGTKERKVASRDPSYRDPLEVGKPEKPPEIGGLALTESNLARQQEQHRVRETRGIDLEEDDPARDQSDFVSCLQGLVGDYRPPNVISGTRTVNLSSQGQIAQILQPTLSADEIGNVEDIQHRPQSPQQQRKQVETHNERSKMQDPHYKPHKTPIKKVDKLTSALSAISSPSQTESDRLLERESKGTSQWLEADRGIALQADGNVASNEDQGDSGVDESEAQSEIDELDDLDLTVPDPDDVHDVASNSSQSGGANVQGGRCMSQSGRQEVQHSALAINALQHELKHNGVRPEKVVGIDIIELSSGSVTSSPHHHSGPSSQGFDEIEMVGEDAVETQDILNAATQHPDFLIPFPPSSDDGFDYDLEVRAHLNRVDSEENSNEDVETWFERMVVRGFPEDSIVKALERTSLRSDLAFLVLLEEKAGNGLPNDIRGIWSKQEDAWLDGADAKMIRRLEEKHGPEELNLRIKWLEDYRNEG